MSTNLWEIVREGAPVVTQDHWLEVRDPEGWWQASVKWDGCVHLTRHSALNDDGTPAQEDDSDYLHICDLDEVIERLTALREMAREHFGVTEWWPAATKPDGGA